MIYNQPLGKVEPKERFSQKKGLAKRKVDKQFKYYY